MRYTDMSMNKIANYYYNLGAQHAHSRMASSMSKTAAPSGKAIAKALGGLSGAALSPAAVHEIGALLGRAGIGGATGAAEAKMLRDLLTGRFREAGQGAASLPGMVGQDLTSIGNSISDAGGSVADYLRSFSNIGGVGG